jgi:hypothetical protein
MNTVEVLWHIMWVRIQERRRALVHLDTAHTREQHSLSP